MSKMISRDYKYQVTHLQTEVTELNYDSLAADHDTLLP